MAVSYKSSVLSSSKSSTTMAPTMTVTTVGGGWLAVLVVMFTTTLLLLPHPSLAFQSLSLSSSSSNLLFSTSNSLSSSSLSSSTMTTIIEPSSSTLTRNQNRRRRRRSLLSSVQQFGSERTSSDSSSIRTTTTSSSSSSTRLYAHVDDYQHTLAILSMPTTSVDRIANEAILNTAVQHTRKLSVVLRSSSSTSTTTNSQSQQSQPQSSSSPSLAKLRQYVGEVYSTLWDVAMASSSNSGGAESSSEFCDVVVYPQNLPNAAPESWIHVSPDLDSVCSHDSICGWSSVGKGRGSQYSNSAGDGVGGLTAHVDAINAERTYRNLPNVQAVHVNPWPKGASANWQRTNHVVFLDDDDEDDDDDVNNKSEVETNDTISNNDQNDNDNDNNLDSTSSSTTTSSSSSSDLIGGVRIPTDCLFDEVAVGGTFDGMHYGHRKLLTLAVSSVHPTTGKLLIGVTVDDMLRHKSYNEQIPTIQERMDGVRDFIYRLAPGIKNRIRFRPIDDEYGPLGTVEEGSTFDALVLSHETLDNGHALNEYRTQTLGLPPVTLLCTRRTEPHGMSSTALRKRKWERKQRRRGKITSSSSSSVSSSSNTKDDDIEGTSTSTTTNNNKKLNSTPTESETTTRR